MDDLYLIDLFRNLTTLYVMISANLTRLIRLTPHNTTTLPFPSLSLSPESFMLEMGHEIPQCDTMSQVRRLREGSKKSAWQA